jgi:hypothetical protein
MFYVAELALERGASGTRLASRGVELANLLECVDWRREPTQVTVCESCGTVGCADGGYARITRLGDHLLWSIPRSESVDEWTRDRYACSEALRVHRNLLMPVPLWDDVTQPVESVPRAHEFREATHDDVRDAWVAERA